MKRPRLHRSNVHAIGIMAATLLAARRQPGETKSDALKRSVEDAKELLHMAYDSLERDEEDDSL